MKTERNMCKKTRCTIVLLRQKMTLADHKHRDLMKHRRTQDAVDVLWFCLLVERFYITLME